jgi:PAS domain S-box-containing protein
LQAIRSHAPVQISDTEAENTLPRIKLRGRAAGYRSVLAIPLNTQYAPPSALLVFRPEPYIFSQREIDLLLSFANHATMAIENATLYARSDMRLQEQTRRIEALIQSLHDGLILENLEGRVIYANRRVSELIGLSPEEISGAHVDKIFERLLQLTGQPERIGQAIRATLDNPEETSVDIECEVKGQPVTIRIQTFKVTDSQDVSIGRGQILLDVTQDREIDRMKSRLVSTVSHELRTPLAAIKGYVTTLLAKDVHWDQASQQEFLEVILAETDRLTSLVNDLLDLSKIEAGNMALRYSECNLFEMAQSAARHAYPSPAGRLHLNVPADLPDLLVDRRLIEAVLRNLIENSVKYAGEQSQIFVHASLENGHAIVQVEDEGPGFPSAQSGAIFEDFSRLENADPFAVPGFGLGLSICRGFVRAHGGDIWVESESRGACVTFSLPLSSEVQPARDRITL